MDLLFPLVLPPGRSTWSMLCHRTGEYHLACISSAIVREQQVQRAKLRAVGSWRSAHNVPLDYLTALEGLCWAGHSIGLWACSASPEMVPGLDCRVEELLTPACCC